MTTEAPTTAGQRLRDEFGANDCITKPFKLDELLAAIKQRLV